MNPFEQLDKQTIEELLIGIENNFHKFKVGNVLKDDYSKHYKLYKKLLEYVIEGPRTKEHQNQLGSDMTYENYVICLLKYELKKR